MMNKSNPFRHLAVAGILCLLAASCSDVTDDGTTLPPGTYPMTFTAGVDRLTATRATTGADGKTTWQENDPVAISMDGGANHKEYTISNTTDGAMIPDGDGNILYWSKRQETLAAWYPVSCTVGSNTGSGEVNITDQNTSFGTLENILHAPAQDYTYSSGGSVAFVFRHALAKVKVTLKKGDGIEESDLSNATVTFTGYTAGSLGYNGMTGSGNNGSITPKTETSSGSAPTYTALVIPQQMQDKKFIKVTIGANGAARDYYYTPTGSTDADLEAGKQYTYTITVKKTGLEVVPAPAWGTGGETTGGSEEVSSFRVKIPTVQGVTPTIEGATGSAGEIYTTTDNSFSITLSVGNGITGFSIKGGVCEVKRTVENGSYKSTYSNIRSDLELVYCDYVEVGDYYNNDGVWSKYYDGTKSIGIVFKVGAAQGDVASNYDGKLTDGIHGYVVALQDAHVGKCAWGGDGVEIGTSINQSDFSGYSNSKKIIEKAEEGGHLKPNDPKSDYPAMYYITEYQKEAVISNSSGWYFPSTGQLIALYKANGDISTNLATAGGSFQKDDYLSSSEFDRGYIAFNVGYVSFNDGNAGWKEKDTQPCYIRAILTF